MNTSETREHQPFEEGDGFELTVEQLEAISAGSEFSVVDQGGTWAVVHRSGKVAMVFDSHEEAATWFRKWIDPNYGL